jgi:sporulation protein YqfC
MRSKRNCRENRRENIIESIGRNLDLPQDALSGYARIEICGNKEATVEGCVGILEYSDSSVAVNTGKLTVRFCGCSLTITEMQDACTTIRGIITGIDFSN